LIVVDTSVLVDFLKGRKTAATDALRRLEIEDMPYAIPAFCCQELLQGAKDQREWELLLEHLLSQRVLASRDPLSSHIEAARIYYDCRRKGMTVRSAVDCFIAQLVLEEDGILLHYDDDFEKIRSVRPLKTLL
jgi:predicted nucleic acid-binding protein